MEFNKNDLKFDDYCYFEEYSKNADGIAEDLANFAGGQLYPTNEETLDKFKTLMKLPIYRGYIEKEKGKLYVDAYKYKDDIYDESTLTNIINNEYGEVEFGIIVSREVPIYNDPYTENIVDSTTEQDVEYFNLGISDLFYYKAGPDGKGNQYFEPYEDDNIYEDEEDYSINL